MSAPVPLTPSVQSSVKPFGAADEYTAARNYNNNTTTNHVNLLGAAKGERILGGRKTKKNKRKIKRKTKRCSRRKTRRSRKTNKKQKKRIIGGSNITAHPIDVKQVHLTYHSQNTGDTTLNHTNTSLATTKVHSIANRVYDYCLGQSAGTCEPQK